MSEQANKSTKAAAARVMDVFHFSATYTPADIARNSVRAKAFLEYLRAATVELEELYPELKAT